MPPNEARLWVALTGTTPSHHAKRRNAHCGTALPCRVITSSCCRHRTCTSARQVSSWQERRASTTGRRPQGVVATTRSTPRCHIANSTRFTYVQSTVQSREHTTTTTLSTPPTDPTILPSTVLCRDTAVGRLYQQCHPMRGARLTLGECAAST